MASAAKILGNTKLLTRNNTKILKGAKRGYVTAIMHFLPADAAGYQVCPMAILAGCISACLNVSGRGAMAKGNATFTSNGGAVLPDNVIQRARQKRTIAFFEDRKGFMAILKKELTTFVKYARKHGVTPCFRPNGTSDLPWESYRDANGETLFDWFPELQIYDYTKVANRAKDPSKLPANYHLTVSYSGASERYLTYIMANLGPDTNVAAVFRDTLPETFLGRRVINGDDDDLRFLDPAGVIVGLTAKNKAKRDTSGFVVDIAA